MLHLTHYYFYFLAVPCSLWDLSSPTGIEPGPLQWQYQILTTRHQETLPLPPHSLFLARILLRSGLKLFFWMALQKLTACSGVFLNSETCWSCASLTFLPMTELFVPKAPIEVISGYRAPHPASALYLFLVVLLSPVWVHKTKSVEY